MHDYSYEEFDRRVRENDPELLAEAKQSGAFEMLVAAVSKIHWKGGAPRDLERFFFSTLRTRSPCRTTLEVLKWIGRRRRPGEYVEHCVAQRRMSIVFIEGKLFGFVPASAVVRGATGLYAVIPRKKRIRSERRSNGGGEPRAIGRPKRALRDSPLGRGTPDCYRDSMTTMGRALVVPGSAFAQELREIRRRL